MIDSCPDVHAVLDVGGTSIKIGAACGRAFATTASVPSSARSTAPIVIGRLRQALDAALGCAEQWRNVPATGVAIAFPGPFDFADGRPLLRGLGKFDAIHGRDLRHELRTGDLPIRFVRDSEAIGVGEARFGAGAAARRVLTIALGTGFGSCLTEDSVPVSDVCGQSIESLYQLVTPDGRVDDVLSASGLARQLGVGASELHPVLEGGGFDEQRSLRLRAYAHRLGAFLASQRRLQADLIVVAGGLAGSFALLHDAVASHVPTPIVAARLGAAGALLGANHLAFPEDRR